MVLLPLYSIIRMYYGGIIRRYNTQSRITRAPIKPILNTIKSSLLIAKVVRTYTSKQQLQSCRVIKS